MNDRSPLSSLPVAPEADTSGHLVVGFLLATAVISGLCGAPTHALALQVIGIAWQRAPWFMHFADVYGGALGRPQALALFMAAALAHGTLVTVAAYALGLGLRLLVLA